MKNEKVKSGLEVSHNITKVKCVTKLEAKGVRESNEQHDNDNHIAQSLHLAIIHSPFFNYCYYLLCNAGTDLLVCICCCGAVASRPSRDGKSRSLMRRGPAIVTRAETYVCVMLYFNDIYYEHLDKHE